MSKKRPESLADRVRRLRAGRGWTMRDLAAAAGITSGEVSHLENGHVDNPRLSTLRGLARAFGVGVEALTG